MPEAGSLGAFLAFVERRGTDRLAGNEAMQQVVEDRFPIKITHGFDRRHELSGGGVPPKFGPVVMRGFIGVWGWFRCLAERRP